MSNTLIQIRKSSSAAAPANGALLNGELAYSHLSDKLFIGNTTGGIIEIGGRYWINAIVSAFETANAATQSSLDATARETANLAFLHANAAFATANASFATGNGAFAKANTANNDAIAAFLTANTVWIHANQAFAAANASFATANLAFVHANQAFETANAAFPSTGGTISGDVIVSGNITVHGYTTYTNTRTLLIGDNIFVLNADLPVTDAPSEDAGFIVNRGSGANVGVIWLEGTDQWALLNPTGGYRILMSNTELEGANAVSVAAFTTGNTAFNTANIAFNLANIAYAMANTANGRGANASYISTGTLAVAYGGTGLNSVDTNGILYGQGTSPMAVLTSSTEGHLLQINDVGVPIFAMLSGGDF